MKLHDFQYTGADFLFDRLTNYKGGGLLADLGIGKTAIMLRAIEKLLYAGQIKRCLVLAPKRVLENTWPSEIALWAPRLTYQSIHGFRYDLRKLPRRDIEFQSSDSVHTLVDYAGRWDLVVVDESHNFKAWSRRRMRSLRQLLKETPKRIISTATPSLVSLGDLHAQMFILDGGEALGKNVSVFRAVYMERHGYMNRQWRVKPGVEKQLLEKIGHMVMRIDAQTHLDMPKLIEHDVVVSMPGSMRAEYNTLKRKLYIELADNQLLVGNAAALYTKLKQYACGQVYIPTGEVRITKSGKKIKVTKSHIVHDAKMTVLKETVESLCGKPAMILYQFKHDCDRILDVVGRKRSRVLNGETSEKEAKKIFDDWNARKFDYLVSHPRCLSEGLNLQGGGADQIWFCVPDKPVEYVQTQGRLYRQGQKEQVRMHRIVMKDTVEELQIDRLDGRIKSQAEFLEALKQFAKG